VKHRSKRLLDRVRDAIRLKGYSVRTEQAYADRIKRFILFHDKRHPREMGYSDIRAFLLHLATEEGVAASTQNQALNALLFLYREVLGKDLDQGCSVLRTEQINRQDLQDEQDKSKKKILEILLILSKNETFMPLLFRTEQPWDLDGPVKAIRAKSAKRVPTVLALPRVLAVAG